LIKQLIKVPVAVAREWPMIGVRNFVGREVLGIHVAVEQTDWDVGLIVYLEPDRLDSLFSEWAPEILLRFGIGQHGDRDHQLVVLLGGEMVFERRRAWRIRYRGAPAAEQDCQHRCERRHSRERIRAARAHPGSVHCAWSFSPHRALKQSGVTEGGPTVRPEA